MRDVCIRHLLESQWYVFLDYLYLFKLTDRQPDSSQAPEDMGIANTDGRGRLLYNEYICYNVAQVRLRYLLRVLM